MIDVVALVQARVGSTRLPGKVLADLCGQPLLTHVLRRVKAADLVDRVCLCIPDTPANDVLVPIAEAEGVDVYRGSEDDVLARFYWAAERYPETPVLVRITADDPLKCPGLIDHAITAFFFEWDRWDRERKEEGHGEVMPPPQYMELGGETWPEGMVVEVFTHVALIGAHKRAFSAADREHVTPWMQRTFGDWKIKDEPMRRSASLRLTVDTQADLDFVRRIYEKLYKPDHPPFRYAAILRAVADLEAA